MAAALILIAGYERERGWRRVSILPKMFILHQLLVIKFLPASDPILKIPYLPPPTPPTPLLWLLSCDCSLVTEMPLYATNISLMINIKQMVPSSITVDLTVAVSWTCPLGSPNTPSIWIMTAKNNRMYKGFIVCSQQKNIETTTIIMYNNSLSPNKFIHLILHCLLTLVRFSLCENYKKYLLIDVINMLPISV